MSLVKQALQRLERLGEPYGLNFFHDEVQAVNFVSRTNFRTLALINFWYRLIEQRF